MPRMGRKSSRHMRTIRQRTQVRIGPEHNEWMAQAACHGHHHLFFPNEHGGSNASRQRVHKAKTICWTQCPVRVECLNYSLTFPAENDAHGIAGGLTPEERDRHRKRRTA